MKLPGYYTSGQFAHMAEVSVRTIRYYDQQNILKPSYINESGANMFDKLEVFETRYEELNQKMYDPSIVSNPDVYTEIMKEYKNL